MRTTCCEALTWGTTYLEGSHIDTARLDAEVLLAYCLGCERSALYCAHQYVLTACELSGFKHLITRRGEHEPVAYLIGSREFWSIPLTVRAGVLIPRPETEFVVETSLRYARLESHRSTLYRLLDVGTGSGNIAIAVATSLSDAAIVAVDISTDALDVARANARACGVADRISYIQSDLLEALNPQRARVDLLLSNPPYIAAGEWADLPETVRRYEPREALDGGPDGLLFYRRLSVEGRQYMNHGGVAIVEVGDGQAGKVCRIFERTRRWRCVEMIKDYSGVERVVVLQCT